MMTQTHTTTRKRTTAYAFLTSKGMRYPDGELTDSQQSCVLPTRGGWELLLRTYEPDLERTDLMSGYLFIYLPNDLLRRLVKLRQAFQALCRHCPKTYALNAGQLTWGHHYEGPPSDHLIRRLTRDYAYHEAEKTIGSLDLWLNPQGFFWQYSGRKEEVEWETAIMPKRLPDWLLQKPRIPHGRLFQDLPQRLN
jgi:hypothetical protein